MSEVLLKCQLCNSSTIRVCCAAEILYIVIRIYLNISEVLFKATHVTEPLLTIQGQYFTLKVHVLIPGMTKSTSRTYLSGFTR